MYYFKKNKRQRNLIFLYFMYSVKFILSFRLFHSLKSWMTFPPTSRCILLQTFHFFNNQHLSEKLPPLHSNLFLLSCFRKAFLWNWCQFAHSNWILFMPTFPDTVHSSLNYLKYMQIYYFFLFFNAVSLKQICLNNKYIKWAHSFFIG